MTFFTNNPVVLVSFAIGIVVLVVALALTYRHLCKKAGPNEALIAVGPKGTKVIAGGSLFVNPLSEKYQIFPLELMSFEVAPEHALYTAQGISVTAEAITQVKVNSDQQASIRTAAEQFLSKSQQERVALIRLVMEGHLRHIVGHLAVEDLVRNTDFVSVQLIESVSPDLEKMGLQVISFTIKDVHDDHGYIQNLGLPQIEELKKQTAIISAIAQREAALAKTVADEERVKAETESLARQAELQRDLRLQQIAFEAEVKQQQALTEQAYDLQTIQHQQVFVAQRIKLQQAEREQAFLEAQTFTHAISIESRMDSHIALDDWTLPQQTEGETTERSQELVTTH